MSEVTVEGSCLCGSVKYRATGEAKRFSHCHCQRCRKATGTGHATNLFISPQTSITWLQGEALLVKYKVPEAEIFYNCFCQKCGGPMPRVFSHVDVVAIPAGSLDTPLPISPQHRIFVDSGADWACSDDLPGYAEYAPEADIR